MDGTPTPAKLVIVSGRSGSGKSTALHVLEDAGFYCIDNLPSLLLPELIEQARESDGIANKRMAVSIDARNMAGHLSRFGDILRMLPQDLLTEVIYLDADDATLIRRFSETRRKHPLSNRSTSLNEAIAAERTLLAAIAERAALTIDTSALSPHDLRELVGRTVAVETDGSMVILFESFGFKHGIPIYADMVFDLRCLPNPHWNPALRRLSGLDEDVAHFLDEQPEVGAAGRGEQRVVEHALHDQRWHDGDRGAHDNDQPRDGDPAPVGPEQFHDALPEIGHPRSLRVESALSGLVAAPEPTMTPAHPTYRHGGDGTVNP